MNAMRAQQYKGWRVWYAGEHPATGKYRAERFGVGLSAGTYDAIIRMIDQKIEYGGIEYKTWGHKPS